MTVYFLQIVPNGPIKIGHTHRESPQDRMCALQTASPWDIVLLGFIDGGLREEGVFHTLLAHHSMRRKEWFHPDQEVLQIVYGALESGKPPDPVRKFLHRHPFFALRHKTEPPSQAIMSAETEARVRELMFHVTRLRERPFSSSTTL